MNELALFAGAGGGILGGHLLGWRTVCAVEWEPYTASVLCARQNDKILPPFPIWDDVQTFDGRPWRGIVQVVSGGFPCQDISSAGKGAGISGKRSSMWGHMARIIGEVRPQFAFVENSPMLTVRGLGVVLGDLSEMGYDCRYGVVSASSVGANHKRDRIWIVAYSQHIGGTEAQKDRENYGIQPESSSRSQLCVNEFEGASCLRETTDMAYTQRMGREERSNEQRIDGVGSTSDYLGNCGETLSNSSSKNVQGQWTIPCGVEQKLGDIGNASWWESEPNVGRVANGVASRVDRLKAIGNGQVPLCAATAWTLLNKRLEE